MTTTLARSNRTNARPLQTLRSSRRRATTRTTPHQPRPAATNASAPRPRLIWTDDIFDTLHALAYEHMADERINTLLREGAL